MGFFDKLKQGLAKTGKLLKTDVRDLFKSEGRLIDEKFLDEMRAILFKTDMGYDAVEKIVAEVATNFRGRVVTLEQILQTWKDKLRELMSDNSAAPGSAGGSETARGTSPIHLAESGPTIILVCGVNGTGKTTSIAKLARMFTLQGKSVVLGAGDTFRAAAVQQLTIWSERLGVGIVTGESGSHPASVAYRTVEQAIKNGTDVAIIDTAGRLQTQKNLMAELTKIQDSIRKQLPEAPHEVLLVLDATTGQNGISQAMKFTEAVKCTGIVLAKLDGTAKGGVVVAIRQSVGLPVKYLGVGEQPEDLTPFNPNEFVDALFAGLSDAPAPVGQPG
jgi:fused signal recognition particle receptor